MKDKTEFTYVTKTGEDEISVHDSQLYVKKSDYIEKSGVIGGKEYFVKVSEFGDITVNGAKYVREDTIKSVTKKKVKKPNLFFDIVWSPRMEFLLKLIENEHDISINKELLRSAYQFKYSDIWDE